MSPRAGSLYSVVQSLQRHELIEVHEIVREGNRPERTVYGITKLAGVLADLLVQHLTVAAGLLGFSCCARWRSCAAPLEFPVFSYASARNSCASADPG